jgi:hypothetical protein
MVRRRSSIGSRSYPLGGPAVTLSGSFRPCIQSKARYELDSICRTTNSKTFLFPPWLDCFPCVHDRTPRQCGHRGEPPCALAATRAPVWRATGMTAPIAVEARCSSPHADPERRCLLMIRQAPDMPTPTDSAPRERRTEFRGETGTARCEPGRPCGFGRRSAATAPTSIDLGRPAKTSDLRQRPSTPVQLVHRSGHLGLGDLPMWTQALTAAVRAVAVAGFGDVPVQPIYLHMGP